MKNLDDILLSLREKNWKHFENRDSNSICLNCGACLQDHRIFPDYECLFTNVCLKQKNMDILEYVNVSGVSDMHGSKYRKMMEHMIFCFKPE